MNRRGKIILSLTLAVLFFIVAGFLGHKSIVSWRLNKTASAAGSMPYQVGLTSVIIIPCVVASYVCTGGTLCNAVDVGDCTLYSDVNGMSAGGSGQPPLLLSKIAIGMAGLMPGGQLIYGGTTNSMYISANAVLASAGGCFGCTAKAGTVDKIFAWLEKLDNYIIAGIKGSKK
ncbi:hypothetical protein A3H09_04185 [Candidatus Falkowbacteria bacterium RIFCSPLOWO2_12_FULL_45_13]|uniref:Uncharacterized protein n=2 Tax=Candidatus Falkowiibacteriota TaxID=1752728 RepID=A0A1F5SBS1_9BACT|nr:MAG: hypothetical protein A3H66_01795 [Candidatus Falkowbacteria bacterium RIFCSPLOWO2_02_FULL_45_21]OGF31101.1 MAG: hypothetical protein A3H09_04185 [Candidatus Falkowbacteria bacterium RIFCSPLOWO2_12_FULL_45_13]